MNPELKQKWTNALLSPDYKRADMFREGHKAPYGYCPLGVLADLNGFTMVPQVPTKIGKDPFMSEYDHKVTDSSKWPIVRGVNWPMPDVSMKIIEMNALKDKKKYTLSVQQIVDFIELQF